MAVRAIDRYFWLVVIARVVVKLGLPRVCPGRGDRAALDAAQRAQLFFDHDRTLLRLRGWRKTPFRTCLSECVVDRGKAA